MKNRLFALLSLVLLPLVFLQLGCANLSGDERPSAQPGKTSSQASMQTPLPAPTLTLRPHRGAPSAAGDAKPEVSSPTAGQNSTAYKLRAMDQVLITLRSIPTPKEISENVDEGGYVNLPYIGRIEAIGLTSSQLEQRIQEAYLDEQIFRQVTVNVVVAAQSYYVRGEVKQPGRFQLTSGVTLLRAIATAGGFTEYANPKKIKLIRGGENIYFHYWELEQTPDKDINIEAGDVIVVPRGWV